MSKVLDKKDLTYEKLEKYITKNAKNINFIDSNGKTSLMTICKKHGKLEFIKLIVESGADVNMIDNHDMNCLSYLFLNKTYFDPNSADYLISQGCNIIDHILFKIINENVLTKEKLNILIKHSPHIFNVNRDDFTPLMYLLVKSPKIEYIKQMIEGGAKVDALDNNEKMCLHYLNPSKLKVSEYNEIIKYIASYVNLKDYPTLLDSIIKKKKMDFDVLKLLLTSNNVNLENCFGEIPLIWYINSTKNPKFNFIKFFVESGTNLERYGKDCLYYLFKHSTFTFKIVEYLVKKGCDINQKDKNGCYILHSIFDSPNIKTFKVFQLIRKRFDVEESLVGFSFLIKISERESFYSKIELMKEIIETGYEPTEEEKNICLYNAVREESFCIIYSIKSINYLLSKGFILKSKHNNTDIFGDRNQFSPPSVVKMHFLASKNLNLGQLESVPNLNYVGIKYNLKSSCTYQLYY